MLSSTPEVLGLSLMLLGVGIIAIYSLRGVDTISRKTFVAWQCLCLAAFGVCTMAWLVGGDILVRHGGYPSQGRIENGKYTLRYRARRTEVTKETWRYLEKVEYWCGHRTFATGVIGLVLFCTPGLIVAVKRQFSAGELDEGGNVGSQK